MRLLRDERPVKSREAFSLGISADPRKATHVFKQIRHENGLKKYMLCHGWHKSLFTP
jgi:hypothetical protein